LRHTKYIIVKENFVRRVEDETKEEKLFFALFSTFAYPSDSEGDEDFVPIFTFAPTGLGGWRRDLSLRLCFAKAWF
jgi:hypothetical protein